MIATVKPVGPVQYWHDGYTYTQRVSLTVESASVDGALVAGVLRGAFRPVLTHRVGGHTFDPITGAFPTFTIDDIAFVDEERKAEIEKARRHDDALMDAIATGAVSPQLACSRSRRSRPWTADHGSPRVGDGEGES